MPEKIVEYKIVDFDNDHEAMEIATRIMDYVGTPEGIKHTVGSFRPVVWALGSRQLYVSDGAMNVAATIGIKLVPSRTVPTSKLPAGRALMLGDAADWD